MGRRHERVAKGDGVGHLPLFYAFNGHRWGTNAEHEGPRVLQTLFCQKGRQDTPLQGEQGADLPKGRGMSLFSLIHPV